MKRDYLVQGFSYCLHGMLDRATHPTAERKWQRVFFECASGNVAPSNEPRFPSTMTSSQSPEGIFRPTEDEYEAEDPQQVHFSSRVTKASRQFGLSYHLQQAIHWNAAPSPLLMENSSPLHDGDLTYPSTCIEPLNATSILKTSSLFLWL